MLQRLNMLGLDLRLTDCTFKSGLCSRGWMHQQSAVAPVPYMLVAVSLELIVGNLHFKYLHANLSQEEKVQRNVFILHNKRTTRAGTPLEVGEHDKPLCIPLPGCTVGVILWQSGSFHMSRLCRFLSSQFVRS